jgi:hypothetical protein
VLSAYNHHKHGEKPSSQPLMSVIRATSASKNLILLYRIPFRRD